VRPCSGALQSVTRQCGSFDDQPRGAPRMGKQAMAIWRHSTREILMHLQTFVLAVWWRIRGTRSRHGFLRHTASPIWKDSFPDPFAHLTVV